MTHNALGWNFIHVEGNKIPLISLTIDVQFFVVFFPSNYNYIVKIEQIVLGLLGTVNIILGHNRSKKNSPTSHRDQFV